MCPTIYLVLALVILISQEIRASPVSIVNRFYNKEVPSDKSSCFYDGRYYLANSSFISKDCQLQCYCAGGGGVSCMGLCTPLQGGVCPVGKTMKRRRQYSDSGPTSCFCTDCVPEFCYGQNGERFRIGESFEKPNCTERCVCTEEGHIRCSPVCPELRCPKGYRVKTMAGKGPTASGCSCPRQRCKKQKRSCTVEGKTHYSGRPFVTGSCLSTCRCRKSGKAHCTPTCPPQNTPHCSHNERLVERQLPVPLSRGRCACTKKACVSVSPNVNTRSQPIVDPRTACQHKNISGPYISSDCRERCRCTKAGHLLCLPLCPTLPVWCSKGEEKIEIRKTVRGSHCSCLRTVCRKRKVKPQVTCSLDGRSFGQGETLVDRNCTQACRCRAQGVMRCRPLCPSRDTAISQCPHDHVITQVPVANAPRCMCARVTCSSVSVDKIEIKEHAQ
ncbi:kielin/chordin-like protein [Nematostella vectensis]|uniref:kielin/chordin-like protein n=1 Tax=Nematostella vectensis TaxID=45351 RepID=UPI00138FC01D|nr:kielin/chordin-like protein [Nematostella vectensis]XP_032223281.1 kielin/chordin-like protein [Nematostella vectensis]XP_032223282.1 kielin/chordin-like protein [Nematostella vectensis]